MPVVTRKALTMAMVTSAKPSASAYRLRDSVVPGLSLRVLPSGLKTYEVHFDRLHAEKLGRHPHMTLEGARMQARAKLGAFATTGERTGPRVKVTTFGDFMRERYRPWVTAERKTGVRTADTIESQFPDLLDKPLSSVTAWAVEKQKAARLKAGVNPATVNRDLVRIKAALAKAVEWKLLADNPLRTVKRAKGEDNGRVRYLTPAEERALRKALDARDAKHRQRRDSGIAWREQRGRQALPRITGYADYLTPMVLVALNTGLRRGELTSITWADVNLPGKMLAVQAGYAKSGKSRHVPLNTEVAAVLKKWKAQGEGEGRVFPLIDPKKAWAAVLVDAEISGFRFHDCRHSFASRLVMSGVDLNTVRELLGHATLDMTLRYAHLAPAHKQAAVEKLVGGRPTRGA